jgi:hypothetical protein
MYIHVLTHTLELITIVKPYMMYCLISLGENKRLAHDVCDVKAKLMLVLTFLPIYVLNTVLKLSSGYSPHVITFSMW